MPVSRYGRDIRTVLQWWLIRDVSDADIAKALEMPTSTYSKRKQDNTFPTFEELRKLAEFFGFNPTILQAHFGYIDEDQLSDELRERYRNYRRVIKAFSDLREPPSPICDDPTSECRKGVMTMTPQGRGIIDKKVKPPPL